MKKKKGLVVFNEENIVREAHEFTEGHYHFKTVWEDRIFLMTLAQIKPSDEDFKEYKIYINDVKHLFGVTTKDIYSCVREAVRSLRKMEIKIPYRDNNRTGMFTTGILTGFGEGIDNMSYISVNLHPRLKPYFLQLKERYTMYNIAFLLKIKNSHSKRIYRLLKQYEKLKKRQFIVQELRERLNIIDIYPDYFDFKKRVILKAQKDLEKYTDIKFSFEEKKEGRKVVALIFYINQNSPERIIEQKKLLESSLFQDMDVSPSLTKEQQGIHDIVKEWGITQETIIEICNSRPIEHIHTCIEVTKDTKSAKNKGAYFMGLVKKDTVVSSKKATKKINESQKAKAKKQELLKKQMEEELIDLKRKKYQKEAIIVKELLEDIALFKIVEEKVSQNQFSYADTNLSFADNYAQKPLFRSFVDKYVKENRAESFESLEADFLRKEKALKTKYLKLGKKI